jgi:hypothetical protein
MSFDINGVNWTPADTNTHAQSMLAYMNILLEAQGLDTVAANSASAIWLILLAAGNREATQDNYMAAAINSFNLSLCDDDQIYNLLPVAGTTLIAGVYSQALLKVTASSTGACVVASGTLSQYGDLYFATTSGLAIPANGTRYVETVCTTIGPNVVPAGSLTSFTTSITNLSSVTNPTMGITGRNVETANQARQRVQNANVIGWNLDGVQTTIATLSGISDAKVYFNFSSTSGIYLQGGQYIPPRNAHIYVYGTDATVSGIANAYVSGMTATTSGAYSETYTTAAGQLFPVYYDIASTQNMYINVYYDSSQTVQPGYDTTLSRLLMNYVFKIGETMTTEKILTVCLNNFDMATLTGASISKDNVNFYRKVIADGSSVPVIVGVNIIGE